MSITLPKGTKEFLIVVVSDKLALIDTLDGVSVTFTVLGEDDAPVVTDAVASVQDMNALCLIDTTTWAEGYYRLFLKIDITPQVPLLGPLKFAVEDYLND